MASPDEANVAVRNAAIEAALQSHANRGKAQRCDCTLCIQLRDALSDGAGKRFADLMREECALVADEIYQRERREEAAGTATKDSRPTRLLREVADRIRLLKGRGVM